MLAERFEVLRLAPFGTQAAAAEIALVTPPRLGCLQARGHGEDWLAGLQRTGMNTAPHEREPTIMAEHGARWQKAALGSHGLARFSFQPAMAYKENDLPLESVSVSMFMGSETLPGAIK